MRPILFAITLLLALTPTIGAAQSNPAQCVGPQACSTAQGDFYCCKCKATIPCPTDDPGFNTSVVEQLASTISAYQAKVKTYTDTLAFFKSLRQVGPMGLLYQPGYLDTAVHYARLPIIQDASNVASQVVNAPGDTGVVSRIDQMIRSTGSPTTGLDLGTYAATAQASTERNRTYVANVHAIGLTHLNNYSKRIAEVDRLRQASVQPPNLAETRAMNTHAWLMLAETASSIEHILSAYMVARAINPTRNPTLIGFGIQ